MFDLLYSLGNELFLLGVSLLEDTSQFLDLIFSQTGHVSFLILIIIIYLLIARKCGAQSPTAITHN